MQLQNKKIIFLSLMLSFSIVLRIVENFLPSTAFLAPGLKLGLANIITVIMLYKFTVKETFAIMCLRILLASVLGAGLSGFLYSIVGGILSFFAMLILKYLSKNSFSIAVVSMIGAIFFNLGQLLVASFMIDSYSIFVYFPVMGIASIVTGIFIGLIAKQVIEKDILWKNLN